MSRHKSVTRIGQQLRQIRDERDLTQDEFGAKVGVSGATVSRWESGAHVPTQENLEVIAKRFQLEPEAFFGRLRAIVQEAQVNKTDDAAEAGGYVVGSHHIELLSDGSLRVNGLIRIYAAR